MVCDVEAAGQRAAIEGVVLAYFEAISPGAPASELACGSLVGSGRQGPGRMRSPRHGSRGRCSLRGPRGGPPHERWLESRVVRARRATLAGRRPGSTARPGRGRPPRDRAVHRPPPQAHARPPWDRQPAAVASELGPAAVAHEVGRAVPPGLAPRLVRAGGLAYGERRDG